MASKTGPKFTRTAHVAWGMLTRRSFLPLPVLLAGCATDVAQDPQTDRTRLAMQDPALSPRNGGLLVGAEQLAPGDIVLSSAHSAQSVGIQALTLSPVSHASLFIGGD